MKYNKIKALVICIMMSVSVFAQTTSPCPVPKDSALKFPQIDLYTGMGLVIGQSAAGDEINFLQSYEFNAGVACRFKWVGAAIYYKSIDFNLKQDSEKTAPNKVLHDNEKISLDNFGLNLFGCREFVKGFFLEGGGYCEYALTKKDVAWDYIDVANSSGARLEKTINKRLDFVNPWNYGVKLYAMKKVHPGYSMYVNYRLSNMFSQGSGFPELPRLVIGLNLNII